MSESASRFGNEGISSPVGIVQPDEDIPFAYNARLANSIELRWQQRWKEEGTFSTPNPSGPLASGFDRVAGLPKLFVMDMFPYPSGAGLHVGHPLGYIGTDVYARFMRMTGHNVLHPFGYDAFGLPAEQYAIATGQHPAKTTLANIANMRRQLRRLGLGHDVRREIATSDPAYYKWTQWIFLKIFNSWFDDEAGHARPIGELTAQFESGAREPSGEANPGGLPWPALTPVQRRKIVDGYRLAYQAEALVNWCPGLGTVLANEEVTADGRSNIGNYPVYRRPLRQWMLRITAYAERLLRDLDSLDWSESIKARQRNWIGPSDGAEILFSVLRLSVQKQAKMQLPVFTTRPDTLPGATYLVLAPEHPMVDALVADSWPAQTPDHWRYPEGAGDAGYPRTPGDAVRSYREHASRLSDRRRGGDAVAKTGVFTGSYVTNPMTGKPIPVFVADYVLMDYGTGAVMGVPAHDQRDMEFARAFGLPIVEVPGSEGEAAARDHAITTAIRWLEDHGAGRRRRTYRLRDWLFSRQRYWGEPIPVVYDEHGLPVALPEEMLPVELPAMSNFRPEPQDEETSDPVPPLARAADWVNVELDLGDGLRRYRRELNTMPQWAGSCWYYLRYLDPDDERRLVDPAVERYWMTRPDVGAGDGGVDLYIGGVEHAVLHLLYARFWHKILYDLGYVSTREPFKRLFNQGYILADAYLDSRGMYVPADEVRETSAGGFSYLGQPVTSRAGKMGKSLKNSVSPDGIYGAYGADTLRLYEMSMGPLNTDRPWQPDDIIGAYRFLQRLWRNVIDERTGQAVTTDAPLDAETAHMLHRTIKIIRADFENLRFNTAIARLTELNNYGSTIAARDGAIPRALAEPLVLMAAPLVPHAAEEIWSRLGHAGSLAYEEFPRSDESLAAEAMTTLPVQVNGRVRFRVTAQADATEDAIRELVTAHPDYARYVADARVDRMVIVPGKIISVVTAT
jgi:leucyl-tRNA synthetase